MTEQQQYRVIADRDKGEDPQWGQVESGDRVWFSGPRDDVDRIERPVSTPDEPERVPEASCFRKDPHGPHYWGQYQGDKYTKHCLGIGYVRIKQSLPTREQIAEAWMSHLGYTAVDMHEAAERGHLGAGCEWDWNHQAWECEDENGKSNHPAHDDLATAYSMADAVLALLQKGADRG